MLMCTGCKGIADAVKEAETAVSKNEGDTSKNTGSDASKSESAGKDSKAYPRYTGFDNATNGYDSINAVLQNCHAVFTYEGNYDICECRPVEGELMTCEDRLYINCCSMYGYEQLMKNKIPEPDQHYAMVREGDRFTVYDFVNKIVAVSDTYGELEESAAWTNTMLPWCLTYCNRYYSQQEYLDEGYSEARHDIREEQPRQLCGRDCPTLRWTCTYSDMYGQKDVEVTDFLMWYDPDTKFLLGYEEWFSGASGVGTDHEKAFENSFIDRYTMSEFDTNCVAQKDIDDIIDKFYKGHESEYEEMDFWDYMENR